MKIALVVNHGKSRWRLNIQKRGFRRRLFFETREDAIAFAQAAGGPVKIVEPPQAELLPAEIPETPRLENGWTFFE